MVLWRKEKKGYSILPNEEYHQEWNQWSYCCLCDSTAFYNKWLNTKESKFSSKYISTYLDMLACINCQGCAKLFCTGISAYLVTTATVTAQKKKGVFFFFFFLYIVFFNFFLYLLFYLNEIFIILNFYKLV